MSKLVEIGRDSVISISVALIVIGATWAVASDRQSAVARIERNTEAIKRLETTLDVLEKKLDYLADGMVRVESKLGTTPRKAGSQP